MHVFPFDLRRPLKQRSPLEKLLKFYNKLLLFIQLACYLVVVSQFSIACGKTFATSVWSFNKLQLLSGLEVQLTNCSYTESRTLGAYDNIPVVISNDNTMFYFVQLCYAARSAIVAAAIAIAVGALNSVLFDYNFFHYSIRALVFRKDIVSVLELGLIIVTFALTAEISEFSSPLQSYLQHCSPSIGERTVPFVSYAAIYVELALTVVTHLFTSAVYIYNALDTTAIPPHPFDDGSDPEGVN